MRQTSQVMERHQSNGYGITCMSAACHEFMLMAVKVNKKQRTTASTVNTKATEAFTEFMKSGTHAVQHCTCSMQHAKKDSMSKQGSRIMHTQQRQGHKNIKFNMHTCHAEFTCRAHKGRMVQKYNIEAPNSCGMGNSALCWLLL